MQVTTPLADSLGRFLNLTSDEMKVTASNMANIDTPGYKTQGFDFSQAFQSELHSSGDHKTRGVRTGPVDGLVARPDGHNVSMDRESLQLAKSQLEFRTGVELLKREYARVMSAIHAEGR